MRLYEFNYKNGSYMMNNSPHPNPLWILAAIGFVIAILILIYY